MYWRTHAIARNLIAALYIAFAVVLVLVFVHD